MNQFINHIVIQFIYHSREIPGIRRLGKRWLQGRDVRIPAGLGVGLRFNSAQSNPAYSLGTNELPVQRALAGYLREGCVFYDIGANVGFFTVIAARLVGKHGQVIAFEPVPENMHHLKQNIALNDFPQVTVIEAAVSDHSGSGELLLSHYSGGSALAIAGAPPDLKGVSTVELVALDDLVNQGKISRPDVVKIDVEGAEMQVLEGMAGTIQKYRPVILYEIDDHDIDHLQHKQQACEAFLSELGYSVMILEESYPGIGWFVNNFLAIPSKP